VVNFADPQNQNYKSFLLIVNILLPLLSLHSLTAHAYTHSCTGVLISF